MKKIIYLMLVISVMCIGIYSADKDWNYLPTEFIAGYNVNLFDNNHETYLDIKNGETSFTIANDGIDALSGLDLYIKGNIKVEVYSGIDLLMEKSFVKPEKSVVTLGLGSINRNSYNGLVFKIKGDTESGQSLVYEAFLFGRYNNILSSMAEIPASNNIIIINTEEKQAGVEYGVRLFFEGDEACGNLKYESSGNNKTGFYAAMTKYDKKELYFDYIPFESYNDVKFEFKSEKGSLLKAQIVKKYIDRAREFNYIADITKEGKIFNALNAYDNDKGSELTGEWNVLSDRVVEAKFGKALYKTGLVFYYMPGYSSHIIFEGVYEDGSFAKIGEFNDEISFYDGNEDVYKKDYERLDIAGYKMFEYCSESKKLSGIRMYLKSEDGKIAGGITELKLYGIGSTNDNAKMFVPTGFAFWDNAGSLIVGNNGSINILQAYELTRSNWNNISTKFSFKSKLTDILSLYKYKVGGNEISIPISSKKGTDIKLDLPENNVFKTTEFDITGKSDFPISIVKINDTNVTFDSAGGMGAFKKHFNFNKEGLYYLETKIGGDFSKRNRVDAIYIDKTAPEIVMLNPKTSYVRDTTVSFSGFMIDLTPWKVEINDVAAKMTGRYFDLENVSVVDGVANEFTIKAYDKAGNVTTKVITVYVDRNPPVVQILNPIENFATKNLTVDMICHIEDMSSVKLKIRGKELVIPSTGEAVPINGNYTIKDVPVYQGENNLNVIATDDAGNTSNASVKVYSDRLAPVFLNTETQYYTNKDIFDYFVRVKDNYFASLYYGETKADQIADLVETKPIENGFIEFDFNANINMSIKEHMTVMFSAVDGVGNASAKNIEIIKDKTAPVITVTTPVDGEAMLAYEVRVAGHYTEEHLKSIKVNGIDALWANGEFYVDNIALNVEGMNTITVIALDLAGNTSSVVLSVKRDTTPPGNPMVHAVCEGEKLVNVYWETTENKEDTAYYLVRRIPAFGNDPYIAVSKNNIVDTDINYDENQIYYYYVQSVDSVGNKSEWKSGSIGKKAGFAPGNKGEMAFDGMNIKWNGDELEHGTYITVHSVEAAKIKDSGIYYSPIYQFGPENLYFNKPVEMTFTVDMKTVYEQNLCWVYYNPDNDKWERVPCWFDKDEMKLKAAITHFSAYAVKQDMTREFVDTDLSALKSSRVDTNILVSESDGSATIIENETTLKGPGQYDFTLTRMINSNTLASNATRTIPLYTTPIYVIYGEEGVVQNKISQNDIYDRRMHVGGWQYNIPRIQGSTIILEEGSINIDSLIIGKTVTISQERKGLKEIKQSQYFIVGSIYNVTDGSLIIQVKTLSGKTYTFKKFNQSYKIAGSNAEDTYYNFILKDDNIFFTNAPVIPVDYINYPDGQKLNFNLEQEACKIYWNSESEINYIAFSQSSCINYVTKETVTYNKGIEKKMYDYEVSTYNIESERYISDAIYTKTGKTGSYSISYDYKSMLAARNEYGKTDYNSKNISSNQLNFGTNDPPAPVFTITYPGNKRTDINFTPNVGQANCKVFSFEKYTFRTTSIITNRKTGTSYVPDSKKEYIYDRTDNSPGSVYTNCKIRSYGYKNNAWTMDSEITKDINNTGKISSVSSEKSAQTLKYKGLNGYIKFDLKKISDAAFDKTKVTGMPTGLSLSFTNNVLSIAYKKSEVIEASADITIDTTTDFSSTGTGKKPSGIKLNLPGGIKGTYKGDAIELEGISARFSFLGIPNPDNGYLNNNNNLLISSIGTNNIETSTNIVIPAILFKDLYNTLDNCARSNSTLNSGIIGLCYTKNDGDKLYTLKSSLSDSEKSDLIKVITAANQSNTGNYSSTISNNYNTQISAYNFKLFSTSDGVSVYCSIISLSEIYFYIQTGGINSEKIVETSGYNKANGGNTDTVWNKNEYDLLGRNTLSYDSRGNFTRMTYAAPDTTAPYMYWISDSSNYQYDNKLALTSMVESGYYTGTIDTKTIENKAEYEYKENYYQYALLSSKTISDKDGKIFKKESYKYEWLINKISKITSYIAPAGTDVKNQIVFVYDKGKRDYTLQKMSIQDKDGNELFYRNYEYENGSGLMLDVWGDNSYHVNFGYDYLGRNNVITFPDNSIVKYTFDDASANYTREILSDSKAKDFLQKEEINYFDGKIDNVKYYTDAKNFITQEFTFDSIGRRVTSSDFKDKKYQFLYDKGYIAGVVNPDDTAKTYTYRVTNFTRGSITKKVLEARSYDEGMNGVRADTRTFSDTYGNVLGQATYLNAKWVGKYTAYNHRSQIVESYSCVQFEFDAATGNVTVNDISGKTIRTANEYDVLGRLVKTTIYGVEYDTSGAYDLIEEYEYDEFDMVVKKKSLHSGVTPKRYSFYKYDGAGNQTRVIEAIEDNPDSATAMTTDITYDRNGNIIDVTYPAFDTNDQTGDRIVKKYIYDSSNRVTQVITNPGKDNYRKVSFYEYDSMGRVYKQYDMRSAMIASLPPATTGGEYVYDDVTGFTNLFDDKYATTFNYDKLGRLLSVAYPDGKTESATYDDNSNLINVTNKQGGITDYWYDVMNRKIFERSGAIDNTLDSHASLGMTGGSTTTASGNYTGSYYTYYENGLLKEKGLSKPIVDNYAGVLATDNVTDIISALSGLTQNNITYRYNESKMSVEIIDPENGRTSYEYNDDGQILKQTAKTGAINEMEYYKGGKVKKNTLKVGSNVLQQSEYEYDETGNMTRYFTGTGTDKHIVKTFEYDDWGLLKKSKDAWGNEKTVTYNKINMPAQITYPDHRIETMTYNIDGQITGKNINVKDNTTWNMNETFNYHRTLGSIDSTSFTETKDGGNVSDLTESYDYDFMGRLYQYNFITQIHTENGADYTDLNYSAEYKHDYATGDDYLKYPGKDNYLKYSRDAFGRLTQIGNTNDSLYTFGYNDGNISQITSITGEVTDYQYDILGRIKNQTTTKGTANIFKMANTYDTQKTDSLSYQEIDAGGEKSNYTYTYDEAERITNYNMTGIKGFVNSSKNESNRRLLKNDYIGMIDSIKVNRPWLAASVDATTDMNQLESVETAENDIKIDGRSNSLEIIYNGKQDGIKIISIKQSNDRPGAPQKTWFDLYYSESNTSDAKYIPVAKQDYTLALDNDRYVFVMNSTISAGKLKVHFTRDDISPVIYYLNHFGNPTGNGYTDYQDTTVDKSLNSRIEAGYKPLKTDTNGIRGRLSDVVKVYAYVDKLSDTYNYDASDRRIQNGEYSTENKKINYTDNNIEGNRITRQGDKTFRYDKCGRRVITLSSEGTYIYRYNLEGQMARVYYSYNRIAISTATFDNIDDNYNYATGGFDLIEENRYNNSGIRVYKWTKKSPQPPLLKGEEEELYYQTPFGYLGVKNLTTQTERLLVNYLSSMEGATANFESVSKSFGNADGASYQSGMSGYNGGQFGIERATINQKIPATTDMQPLCELKDGGIPTTSISDDILWASFEDSSLTTTSIDVATTFDKYKVLSYHKDQIGSVRMVTELAADDTIHVVWRCDYSPYGEMLTEDFNLTWLPLKTFALHEYDRETGLIYAQQRWYDPETAQFVSEDGAQDGLNWYGYCGGNPVGMIDPSGLTRTTGQASAPGAGNVPSRTGGPGEGGPSSSPSPGDQNKELSWGDKCVLFMQAFGNEADPNYNGNLNNWMNGLQSMVPSSTKLTAQTVMELWDLCKYAYNNPKEGGKIPSRWSEDWDDINAWGLNVKDDPSGFKSMLYKHESGLLAYVFAGTDEATPGDDVKNGVPGMHLSKKDNDTNTKNALGMRTDQYDLAVENVRLILKNTNNNTDNLVLAGHSLGGGLASIAGVANKVTTITFNASGQRCATITRYGGVVGTSSNYVTAFYLTGDFLSYCQDDNLFYSLFIPQAIGYRIKLGYDEPMPGWFSSKWKTEALDRHSSYDKMKHGLELFFGM